MRCRKSHLQGWKSTHPAQLPPKNSTPLTSTAPRSRTSWPLSRATRAWEPRFRRRVWRFIYWRQSPSRTQPGGLFISPDRAQTFYLLSAQRRTRRNFLSGRPLASRRLLLLFHLLPSEIRVVFLQGFSQNVSPLAEILLIHVSIVANHECHHPRRPVFRRISHKSEPLCHLAISDVTLRSPRAILTLTSQDAVIVTVVRSRSAVLRCGIALSHGRRHQRTDGTLGFALGSSPVEAIVLPLVAQDLLGVFALLRGMVFLLRCHQRLANANGPQLIPANAPE